VAIRLPGVRDRVLGLCGVAVVLGAALWALAGGPTASVVTLVVIGLVLAAADALVWRATGPGQNDLTPPEGRRLAGPPWGLLVGPAAALGLGASVVVGAPFAAVGIGLVLAGTLLGVARPAPEAQLPAHIVSTARRLRAFARAHGARRAEPVDGYLTPVGESGTRLLVIAPDGEWAEAMVSGGDAEVIAGLARIELREPTESAAAKRLRIDQADWAQMTRSW